VEYRSESGCSLIESARYHRPSGSFKVDQHDPAKLSAPKNVRLADIPMIDTKLTHIFFQKSNLLLYWMAFCRLVNDKFLIDKIDR
jgi:hypothetical protein